MAASITLQGVVFLFSLNLKREASLSTLSASAVMLVYVQIHNIVHDQCRVCTPPCCSMCIVTFVRASHLISDIVELKYRYQYVIAVWRRMLLTEWQNVSVNNKHGIRMLYSI